MLSRVMPDHPGAELSAIPGLMVFATGQLNLGVAAVSIFGKQVTRAVTSSRESQETHCPRETARDADSI